MGIKDDAEDVAQKMGRKLEDAWKDTKDRVGDKIDEVKADANAKKAEAEAEAVHAKNDAKERMRED